MKHLPKNLLSAFLFFLLIIILGTPGVVYAAAGQGRDISNYGMEEYNRDRRARMDAAEKGETIIEGAGTTGFQNRAIIADFTQLIGGCFGETNSKYCNPQKSAIGNVTSLMATLYAHPPASGLAYTADLLANAGLVKPVYAQGVGFSALTPFLPFWKVTRNVAYAALILMMIAIGFMIIFRMKIDPKTIISIQAALPKIVLTLILITFSYPIVGFIIDLMYLTMAIAISLMVSGMGGSLAGADTANLQSTYMTAGAGDLFGAIFWPVLAFLKSFAGELIGTGAVSGIIYALGTSTILPSIALFGSFGWPILLALTLPALILGLIIVLGLLFTFIRLLLLLLNSYIQVVISLILGPIILLGETIPGKAVFTGWLMNIIANLVVFPATAVVIMFSVWLTAQGQTDAPKWSPPFIGFYTPGGNFHAFLGLGVMFIAPTLVAQIKKAFGPKPIMPISPSTMVAPLTGSFQTGLGAMQSFYYVQSAGQSIPVIGKFLGGPQHAPRKQA